MPEISVIICVYKNSTNLRFIFEYLKRQSFQRFEVIVAEDDNSPEMSSFIQNSRAQYSFSIRHVSQQDQGFRKCKILNAAILASQADFLVFLDGDCLPHPQFLEQYHQAKKEKYALVGRRVMLSAIFSEKLINNNMKINMLNMIKYKCDRIEEGIYFPFLNVFKNKARGIWGCNWGILKKYLLDVNGYDEDYIKAGIGEDTDIEWRLLKSGITLKSMKFKAIVYHLYHKENYSSTSENEDLLKVKKLEGHSICLNGIKK